MRTKLYRNQQIIRVVHDLFFSRGLSAYAHRFDLEFPRFEGPNGVQVPMLPTAMLALVGTAVRVTYKLWIMLIDKLVVCGHP